MAGFYLTNNKEVFDKVLSKLTIKLKKYKIKSYENYKVAFFQKLAIDNHCNIFESKVGYIVGVGTYYYKNKFGSEALPLIFKNYNNKALPFAEVGGHFAFLCFSNNQLEIITDKTGHYPVYYALEEEFFYFSTSFLGMCESLSKLKVSKQGFLEYINANGVFGGETLFKNINHLDYGSIYKASTNLTKRNYYESNDSPTALDEIPDILADYFNFFKHTYYSITCDITSGYDTRLIASILMNNNCVFRFNTAISKLHPLSTKRDLMIARRIAQSTNVPLDYVIDETNYDDYEKTSSRCFDVLEMARGIAQSREWVNLIQKKSNSGNIILSGYGGENYIDSYNFDYNSLEDLINGIYTRISSIQTTKDKNEYFENILEKFRLCIRDMNETNFEKIVEKIYYMQKMRFWGGGQVFMHITNMPLMFTLY